MITSFYMPTRIVSGAGALGTIGTLARDLRMTKVLVVSDPVIAAQGFHAEALAALEEAGLSVSRFDECGIDARCSHIDAQGERVRQDGIDGVVCIGGVVRKQELRLCVQVVFVLSFVGGGVVGVGLGRSCAVVLGDVTVDRVEIRVLRAD